MSPGLSAHLVEIYEQQRYKNQAKIPFQRVDQNMTNVIQAGNMSYNANMQGLYTFQGTNLSPNLSLDDGYQETNMTTLQSIATLQAKLNQKLGPEYISQRPAPGGAGKLSYVEGWKIIALANEVFGFNGWSSSITSLNVDYIDCSEETKRFNVGVTAIIRVTLRDGVYHEDVGYGLLENSKSKGQAIDKCKKEAVTDALKRTLRNFGNLMGNCLYDKAYTSEVVKIKIPPPKFDKSTLHRRPEFDDNSAASTSTSAMPPPPQPHLVKQEPPSAAAHASNRQPPQGVAHPQAPPPAQAVQSSTSHPDWQIAAQSGSRQLPQRKTSVNSAEGAQRRAAALAAAFDEVPDTVDNAQSGVRNRASGFSNSNSNLNGMPPANVNGSTHATTRTNMAANASANANVKRAETSFALNSDDDAFFASVDLDTDMGRPIDYEDDDVSGSGSGLVLPPQDRQGQQGWHKTPNSNGSSGSGLARQVLPPQHQQQHQPQMNGGSNSGGQQQQQRQMSTTTAPMSRQPNQMQAQNQNQPRNAAPPPPRVNPIQMNGSVSAPRNAAGGQSDQGAGMVYAQQRQNQGQIQAQAQQKPLSNGPPGDYSHASNGGGVGLKRDSAGFQRPVAGHPAQGRGPNPGSGPGAALRPPLKDIELGSGGDAKRPRKS